jgi:hypothetical protein
LDDTDFKTAETGLTIANTDVKLVVNGGASADKNSGGGTHRVNGVYGLTFDATDTATVGEMEVSIKVAGALPVFMKFWILEEAVYDALFAASAPGYVANAPVNVAQFGGSNGTFSGGRPEVNVSHYVGSAAPALVGGRFDASVGAMAANVMTAAAAAADLSTELRTAINGGDYALSTDANGRIRIVDGTGTGELDTTSGKVNALLAAGDVTGNLSAVLANGVTHGGATAMLRLGSSSSTPALHVTNSGGHAAQIESSGSGNDALRLIAAAGEALELSGTLNIQGALVVSSDFGIGGQISVNNGIDGNLLGSIGSLSATAQGNVRTAVGLAAANLDTQLGDLPTAAENAAGLLDLANGIETGVTPRQAFRGMAAALFGQVTGAGSGTEVFRAAGVPGTTRLTYTVDAAGNRTGVALNLA